MQPNDILKKKKKIFSFLSDLYPVTQQPVLFSYTVILRTLTPYLQDNILLPRFSSLLHQDLRSSQVPVLFIGWLQFSTQEVLFPLSNNHDFLSCEDFNVFNCVWAWAPCVGTMMLPWAAPHRRRAVSPVSPTPWLSGVLCCSREMMVWGWSDREAGGAAV